MYLKEKMRWCLVRKENGFNRFLFPSVMEVLEQNSPVKSLLFRRCKKSTVVDQKSLLGWFCERVQIGGGNHKSLMSHKVVTKIQVSLHFGGEQKHMFVRYRVVYIWVSCFISFLHSIFAQFAKFGYIDQITEKAICARLTPPYIGNVPPHWSEIPHLRFWKNTVLLIGFYGRLIPLFFILLY